MNPRKKKQLATKGWTEEEIKHAESVLEKTEQHDVYFSKIVFWSALLVIIFANIIVAFILIPFLVVLNNFFLYFIIALLAATVGFLYNFLITDIGHLEQKHHRIAAVVIPLLTIINSIMVVQVSNSLAATAAVQNTTHNPWMVAVVFAIAFILPYIFDQVRQYFSFKKAMIV